MKAHSSKLIDVCVSSLSSKSKHRYSWKVALSVPSGVAELKSIQEASFSVPFYIVIIIDLAGINCFGCVVVVHPPPLINNNN